MEKPLRLCPVHIRPEDHLPRERGSARQGMLRNENPVVHPVELHRLAIGRIDHMRLSDHLGRMPANTICAVKTPDLLL